MTAENEALRALAAQQDAIIAAIEKLSSAEPAKKPFSDLMTFWPVFVAFVLFVGSWYTTQNRLDSQRGDIDRNDRRITELASKETTAAIAKMTEQIRALSDDVVEIKAEVRKGASHLPK